MHRKREKLKLLSFFMPLQCSYLNLLSLRVRTILLCRSQAAWRQSRQEMPCNTVLAAKGGAGYSSCNKMVFKPFYQETVLWHSLNNIEKPMRNLAIPHRLLRRGPQENNVFLG